MKILLINGLNYNESLNNPIIKKLNEYIKDKNSTSTLKNLYELSLKPCNSCDYCQNKNPGICVIKDGQNELLYQYISSDITIIITPIMFGSCNSTTKTFLDRTQPLYLPYQKLSSNIMQNRYDKYPDIVFVGIIDDFTSNKSIENFKNSMLNSTLALHSKKRLVKIVKTDCDIKNFDFL